MPLKDMTGLRFGKLLVVKREPNKADGTARWFCVCDCGQTRVIAGTGLRAGRHKSCGCSSPRFTPKKTQTHGLSKSRTYRIWTGMLARCSSAAQGKSRRNYYEKGVRVCERWLEFENFLADMGEVDGVLTLERIDSDGNYEPSNCIWADRKVQANNTSQNHKLTVNGLTKNISQWAEETGIKANTIIYRLRRGVSPEQSINPNYQHKSITEKRTRARPCLVCSKEFIPRTGQLRAGHGKYCSQACNGAARAQKYYGIGLSLRGLA